MGNISGNSNIVRHIKFLEQMIIKSSLKLKLNRKSFKRFRAGSRVEHKEIYKIKKCGTHLTFFI